MSLRNLPSRLWSTASFAFVRNVLWHFHRPTYVILLGGPGAGKGTLAAELAPALGLTHMSTGNLFRKEIERGTSLGKSVAPILKAGGLVPDALTIAVVAEELSRLSNWRGAVLDGFPRTEAQALLLEDLLSDWGQEVCFVFFLDVEKSDLLVRLSGRRTCKNKACGATYHVEFNPPKVKDKCDKCGSELYQRDDDKPEVVESRMIKFAETNDPMLRLYGKRGRLITIKSTNADGKDSVLKRVLKVIAGSKS